jgi:hypothetical protein
MLAGTDGLQVSISFPASAGPILTGSSLEAVPGWNCVPLPASVPGVSTGTLNRLLRERRRESRSPGRGLRDRRILSEVAGENAAYE